MSLVRERAFPAKPPSECDGAASAFCDCAWPLLAPGADEGFRLDAERFRNARDEIEVGDDLHCVVDRAVVEALLAQGIEITRPHAGRFPGELLGDLAQRPIGRIE